MKQGPTCSYVNSMAGCLAEAGAIRWRMSLGVPKVSESMSSVLMP